MDEFVHVMRPWIDVAKLRKEYPKVAAAMRSCDSGARGVPKGALRTHSDA